MTIIMTAIDDAACAIASAVHAEKLAFLTDTEGVFRVFEDKDSFIPTMTVTEAEEFVASGAATGGMLPKLTNCIQAWIFWHLMYPPASIT